MWLWCLIPCDHAASLHVGQVSELEQWNEDDDEWEEVEVQRLEEQLVHAVNEVEDGATRQLRRPSFLADSFLAALIQHELAHTLLDFKVL